MTEATPSTGPVEGQAGEQLRGDPSGDAWGNPPRRSQDTALVLSVEGFEGSLDCLLEMARAQKIDLARLSIRALVEAFAAALDSDIGVSHRSEGNSAHATDLSRWGDWLVMAATLTLLRSRLLLPPDTPQGRAAQDETEILRRQLIRRAEMATAARWLDRRPKLGREVLARGRPEHAVSNPVSDITGLFRACLVVLRIPKQEEIDQPKSVPLWRVVDALARITRLIEDMPKGGVLAVFLPKAVGSGMKQDLRCRAAVASTFVAGLELARNSTLALEQETLFGPVAFRPVIVSLLPRS